MTRDSPEAPKLQAIEHQMKASFQATITLAKALMFQC